MSWVYLTVSINGALYTLNALAPRRKSRLLFAPSFFASWITIELAWAHLIWQVAATVFFARKGALRSTPGKLGFLITVGSWAGLLFTVKQSIDARHHVREAFRELVHEPQPRERFGVRVERNVEFTRVAGKTLRLDVWAPDEPVTPGAARPALIQIHGGGWTIGDKREQGRLLLRRMASDGWVGFNVNYRLSPGATFPDHLVDVKAAIAWVRDHAAEYGVDPGFIAVTGGSAGGHLAALVALTADDERYQPGFEEADTSVQAAVPFYGVYDFTNRNGTWPPEAISQFVAPIVMKAFPDSEPEKFRDASPMDRVRADAPPFLVIHGDRDTLAPIEDAREFVERLRNVADEPVYYLELKGAQHAFEIFPSIRANQVIEAAAHYLDAVWTAYRREGGHLEPVAVEKAVGEELDTELLAERAPVGD